MNEDTELMPDQLFISPDVAFIDTEYGIDQETGQAIYRHHIITEWQPTDEA